jgi:hypothetical protein
MPKNEWIGLTGPELNRSAKEEVQSAFVGHRCTVSLSKRPFNFVVRTPKGRQLNVVVRSFRSEKKTTYIFIEKAAFNPDPALFLAVVRFEEGSTPGLFLIPSWVDGGPNPLFENRPYTDKHKSPPEWGLTLSEVKMGILRNEWPFRETVARL